IFLDSAEELSLFWGICAVLEQEGLHPRNGPKAFEAELKARLKGIPTMPSVPPLVDLPDVIAAALSATPEGSPGRPLVELPEVITVALLGLQEGAPPPKLYWTAADVLAIWRSAVRKADARVGAWAKSEDVAQAENDLRDFLEPAERAIREVRVK